MTTTSLTRLLPFSLLPHAIATAIVTDCVYRRKLDHQEFYEFTRIWHLTRVICARLIYKFNERRLPGARAKTVELLFAVFCWLGKFGVQISWLWTKFLWSPFQLSRMFFFIFLANRNLKYEKRSFRRVGGRVYRSRIVLNKWSKFSSLSRRRHSVGP